MTTDHTPIEAYGLVGNLETCGLVGPDGSLDWYPVPHVESPSAFAAILDDERGGHFRVGAADGTPGEPAYLQGTNVLRTTFETVGGTLHLTDFLPPVEAGISDPRALYRRARCVDGAVELAVAFEPRLDYARTETSLHRQDGDVVATGEGDQRLVLGGDVDPSLDADGARATASEQLAAGETRWLCLTHGDRRPPASADCGRALERTVAFWREWSHDHGTADECVFQGPWHDAVVRSELALKLLTHAGTGTVAAAPTTSLPEEIGGVRNWDYRYTWPRDAAFVIQALAHLGHLEEADAYFEWFLDLCRRPPAEIRPLYGLHGETDQVEVELDHLRGYRESAPVRVGNAAAGQRQLDVYGELVLAVATAVHHGWELGEADWPAYRAIVEHVAEVWAEPDNGIWEVRTGPRQFVHSKLMCWTALDRGVWMATERGWPAPVDRWRAERGRIRETILDRGFDADRATFTRTFDGDALDATALLVPMVGFLPFDDDRVAGTVDAVREHLETDDGLLRRYDGEDGLPGDEGTFTLCSCWLVDVLALSGRIEAARERFERLLGHAGPLDLFAEELDPGDPTGTHRGNYPQAFSHVGLITSALTLGRIARPDEPGAEPVAIWLGEGPAVPD